MNTNLQMDKLSDWFQVAASIGVIIGLILVAFELEQSRVSDRRDLVDQNFTEAITHDRSFIGEEVYKAWTVACMQPEELTPEHAAILIRYFSSQAKHVTRYKVLSDIYDEGYPWQLVARAEYGDMLSLEHGRYFYSTFKRLLPPELSQIGDEILQDTSRPSCKQRIETFLTMGSPKQSG